LDLPFSNKDTYLLSVRQKTTSFDIVARLPTLLEGHEVLEISASIFLSSLFLTIL